MQITIDLGWTDRARSTDRSHGVTSNRLCSTITPGSRACLLILQQINGAPSGFIVTWLTRKSPTHLNVVAQSRVFEDPLCGDSLSRNLRFVRVLQISHHLPRNTPNTSVTKHVRREFQHDVASGSVISPPKNNQRFAWTRDGK